MKIVIIGNGISGITLARHIRKKSDHSIMVISEETKYFFSRTALMYVYMGHLKFEHTQPYEPSFWRKNRIDLIHDTVININIDSKAVKLNSGLYIAYDKLIIASGSKPNKLGWPGQNLGGVMGMYHKQELEMLEKYTPKCKRAVVVGGGLIGIELVEMLRSRNIEVTFLVRESSFWNNVLPPGESEMINRHIREHHIDLRLDTNLVEIFGDENGDVKSLITDKGEEIDCQIVGLTTGVSPNIDFLKDSKIETNKGVLVNRLLETNIPDVYAVGDCAEQRENIGLRKTVEAVWYTGRIMGETLAQTICGIDTEYQSGNWFNSAKFLDIEYQTYGWVFPEPRENEQQFYWEHKNGKKAIRISFDRIDKKLLGINTFGIRLRHEFFENALNNYQTVYEVLENFSMANFDPEFYPVHEKEIVSKFNNEFNTTIQLRKNTHPQIYSSI